MAMKAMLRDRSPIDALMGEDAPCHDLQNGNQHLAFSQYARFCKINKK